jgi:tetratricopeptide (TPR) repeat protein
MAAASWLYTFRQSSLDEIDSGESVTGMESCAVRVMKSLLVFCIAAGGPACSCQQPDLPETHLNLGIAHMDKGDLDGAIAEYRQALRLKPDDAKAHFNLGVALRLKGDLDGAIAEYREALRLKPDFPGAQNNLAIALRLKGGVDGGHP